MKMVNSILFYRPDTINFPGAEHNLIFKMYHQDFPWNFKAIKFSGNKVLIGPRFRFHDTVYQLQPLVTLAQKRHVVSRKIFRFVSGLLNSQSRQIVPRGNNPFHVWRVLKTCFKFWKMIFQKRTSCLIYNLNI